MPLSSQMVGLRFAAAALGRRRRAAGDRPLGPAARLTRRVVLAMIKRRAAAGFSALDALPHVPSDWITAYLLNGGGLEHAQQIAGHASPQTTKLDDRTADATVPQRGRPRWRGVCVRQMNHLSFNAPPVTVGRPWRWMWSQHLSNDT